MKMDFNEKMLMIKKIGLKYGLNVKDAAIQQFLIFADTNNFLEHLNDTSNLKTAQLIKLFNDARVNSSEITISTTIKGRKECVKISDDIDILHISNNINNYLICLSSGWYEYEFNWNLKKDLTDSYYPKDPYNDEELNQIIAYEKKRLVKAKDKPKDKFPNIGFFVYNFRESNMFDNKIKTIKTNEACFLYDSLVQLGMIKGDDFYNSQEKYQYIKRHLK